MSDYFDSYSVNQHIAGNSKLAVNQLPVGLLDFALISNMRHRIYGVRVFGDEDCDISTCCLNDTARQSIWRILFNIQQNIMAKKKVTAGPAYFKEKKLIDHAASTFQTTFGAVEKVDVQQDFTFLVNLHISPFIIHDVQLQNNGGKIEALFDSTIVQDPQQVILRDSDTYEQFAWTRLGNDYPVTDDFNWVMPCPNQVTADYLTDPDKSVSLQHYEYMIAETPTIDGVDVEDLIVFHPNTFQVMPFAKEPEVVISEGEERWRFWFYCWTLGKPEFGNNPPDLVKGEFHKLYDTLELFQKVEVEALPNISLQTYPDCTDEMEVQTQVGSCIIIDSFSGMIKFTEDANTKYGKRYNVEYYYKVNPLTVEHIFSHSTEELKRAIVAKTAATINLQACGCLLPKDGNPLMNYITEMQQTYTKEYVSPITGAVAVNYMYGNKHGDLLFAEMMKSITFRPKGFMV